MRAAQAVEDIRGLLQQQEYEYQSLLADMQLVAIDMQDLLTLRKMTDAEVGILRGGAVNFKHELREARHALAGAHDYLQEIHATLLRLELND